MALSYDKIPTKASQLLSDEVAGKESTFEVFVHTKRVKKEKKVVKNVQTPESDTKKDQGFDIKRARHDVIRFGASGLVGEEKKNAQVALAIKLGAKPPKGKPKSLKELQEERRKLAKTQDPDDKYNAGLQAKKITHFHCNQLISNAQRRKRKRNDEHNTIRDYGKVDP